MILINKKNGRCLKHSDEEIYTKYCLDCKEHLCHKDDQKHLYHNYQYFFEIQPDVKTITEKNKILLNIIKFNEIILEAFKSCPTNYFHRLNIVTLADSIKNENKRDSKYINFAINGFQNKFNEHQKNIDELNEALKKFNVTINGEEEQLSLNGMNLNDKILKNISHIYFNKLKKMDISGNNFSDIKCLKYMDLSLIEMLNLSNNKIKNIDVFEYMKLDNLKELYLHKNKIEDAKVFLKTTLPKIKKIRLENNSINSDLQDFKLIERQYGSILNYKAVTISDFNKKYECDISEKSKDIRIDDKDYGDTIIEELSLINTNYDKLEQLSLINCSIKDISALKFISFKLLKSLDLSLNKIEKIEVLVEINLSQLTNLFLSDNNISDIYPLKMLNSKKLEKIKLKNNPIMKGNNKDKNQVIINYLIEKKEVKVEYE